MVNQRKRLKLGVLLFATMFLVGAAFAATNGMLVFGGTVRINNLIQVEAMRLEFVDLTAVPWDQSILEVSGNLVNEEGFGTKRLNFDVEVFDILALQNQIQTPVLEFTIQNTGTVPVRFLGMDEDWFTTAHPFAVVDLRRNGNQVWFTQGLTHGDAELIGVIEPGEYFEGRIRITELVVGYYFADVATSFGFSTELLYEVAR